jgi:hypothetical protein
MKQLLTALLIVLVFGCKGNAQIKEFYSDSLCIMKIVDNRAVCYLMCTGENQKLNYYFDCKKIIIAPKPSPTPDTTKPIKVKMQPRWRTEDAGIYVFKEAPIQVTDMTGSKPTAMFLVCDTSTENGFLSNRVYWIYGGIIHAEYWTKGKPTFLDMSGKELPKNIIVWLSKEIK